jgi:hypothetical protein
MSHFYTMVLIPNTVDVESAVDNLLAPYSENPKVKAYQETCWCVEHNARNRAEEIADRKFGTFDSLREEFGRTYTRAVGVSNDEAYWAEQEAWSKLIRPRVNMVEELSREFLMDAEPDPNCEECKGTGSYTSTYNPKAKWDWYQIGGRWTGVLDNYNPEKDPKNQEPCPYCKTTGIRTDLASKDEEITQSKVTVVQLAEAFTNFYQVMSKLQNVSTNEEELLKKQANDIAESIGGKVCNACRGTGVLTSFTTQWVSHSGDVMPVTDLLALSNEEFDKRVGFAVVTPDGEWHEKGEMGWFGISSCEVDPEDWKEAVRVLLTLNKDCNMVVVDCHI